ncbi:MAG: hypothetical protein ABI548_16855 [Polyangiaceae bacterium]
MNITYRCEVCGAEALGGSSDDDRLYCPDHPSALIQSIASASNAAVVIRDTEPAEPTGQAMTPLVVVITVEQRERLQALCKSSELSSDEQIGAMIDLDFEEWQDPDDARLRDLSRSTRFARFVAQDGGAS